MVGGEFRMDDIFLGDIAKSPWVVSEVHGFSVD